MSYSYNLTKPASHWAHIDKAEKNNMYSLLLIWLLNYQKKSHEQAIWPLPVRISYAWFVYVIHLVLRSTQRQCSLSDWVLSLVEATEKKRGWLNGSLQICHKAKSDYRNAVSAVSSELCTPEKKELCKQEPNQWTTGYRQVEREKHWRKTGYPDLSWMSLWPSSQAKQWWGGFGT